MQSSKPALPERRKRDSAQFSRTKQISFPAKLHLMLEETEANGQDSIVSWDSSGRAFRVHRPGVFVKDIMPIYFRQTKYKSFTRQLNLYGFQRVTNKDLDHFGFYFHERFQKGDKTAAWNQSLRKPQRDGDEVTATAGGMPGTLVEQIPGSLPAEVVAEAFPISHLYRALLPHTDPSDFSTASNIHFPGGSQSICISTASVASNASVLASRRNQNLLHAGAAHSLSTSNIFPLHNKTYATPPVPHTVTETYPPGAYEGENSQRSSMPDETAACSVAFSLQQDTAPSYSSTFHHNVSFSAGIGKALENLCSLTKFEFPQDFDFSILEPAPLGSNCKPK